MPTQEELQAEVLLRLGDPKRTAQFMAIYNDHLAGTPTTDEATSKIVNYVSATYRDLLEASERAARKALLEMEYAEHERLHASAFRVSHRFLLGHAGTAHSHKFVPGRISETGDRIADAKASIFYPSDEEVKDDQIARLEARLAKVLAARVETPK
jgi:hypothetical protein